MFWIQFTCKIVMSSETVSVNWLTVAGREILARRKSFLQHTHTTVWSGHVSDSGIVQLDHMQVCTLLQTDNRASTPPLSFYGPEALPATQPTASKH